MLHVGGQEKPSVAAQAQEACTHECGRKSRRTLGQKVPAGIRKARVKVSAVKPWAERWQWTSAFRSSTCLPSALTCEAPAERGARTGSLLAYMLGGKMGAHRSREVLLILCACTLRFGGPRRRLYGLASTCIGHGLRGKSQKLGEDARPTVCHSSCLNLGGYYILGIPSWGLLVQRIGCLEYHWAKRRGKVSKRSAKERIPLRRAIPSAAVASCCDVLMGAVQTCESTSNCC